MQDLIKIEGRGIPTVAIVAKSFEAQTRASAHGLGLLGFPYAMVKDCLTGLSPEEITRQAGEAVPAVIEGLTKSLGDEAVSIDVLRPEPTAAERFEAGDHFKAFQAINRAFLERGWADGFPLWPATREATDEMLAGTTRPPQDIVGILSPGHGLATVEKIAVNAVMAGCSPSHMPVLIAIVEAVSNPPFPLGPVSCSTGPHAPLVLINGPIAKQLGINAGGCALGPGAQSKVNIAIGRALRLIIMNIGHAYPGQGDMDTLGSACKFSLCLAENEEASPWPPYHVTQGFSPESSTVTVFGIRDMIDINEMWNHTAEGIVTTVAAFASIPGGEYLTGRFAENDSIPLIAWHALLILCPDHARSIYRSGWTREHVEEFFYHRAQAPLKNLLSRVKATPSEIRPIYRWTLDAPPEMTMPVLQSPKDLHVVVAGASSSAGKSQYVRLIGQPSATVEIMAW